MKVTVTKPLNVRVGSPSVNAPCFQYLAAGSELIVDGKLYKGDLFDNVDTWLRDELDNYYWSGGVNHSIPVQEFLKLSRTTGKPITFSWFDQLKVKTVWDNFREKGDRAKIAVLDTGFATRNTELRVASSKLIIDQVHYPGVNLVIDDQSNDFHGTRCASLIAARNSRDWIVGVAPESEVIVGKISIDKEIMDFNYILEGIKWAVSQQVDVISISYAYEDLKPSGIPDFEKKIKDLVANKNILVFGSCGNSGSTQRTGDFHPASFDDCVSVGASNALNQVSKITVLSDKTIIHAPGEQIESYDQSNTPTPQSGTSFSTPIVAGIAALAVSFLKKKNNGQWNKADLLAKIYGSGDAVAGSAKKKIINPVNLFNQL